MRSHLRKKISEIIKMLRLFLITIKILTDANVFLPICVSGGKQLIRETTMQESVLRKKNHPVTDTGELRTFCARLTLTRRSVDRSILNQRNHDFFIKE